MNSLNIDKGILSIGAFIALFVVIVISSVLIRSDIKKVGSQCSPKAAVVAPAVVASPSASPVVTAAPSRIIVSPSPKAVVK